MAVKLITAPDPIVTWGEADQHLRLDGDETQKALVEAYIAAATQYLDGMKGVLGYALGLQVWELTLDSFPCSAIKLPLGPLVSVQSVKHDDDDGIEQTVDPDSYVADAVSLYGWVVPISGFSWPATLDAVNAVRVRFTVGHAAVDEVDKQIVKLIIGHWFENRETVVIGSSVADLPMAVNSLIGVRRRLSV